MEKCGIDLHPKSSQVTVVDDEGEVLGRATIPTTRTALTSWFGRRERMRIVMEASGTSPWVSRLLGELGHEVEVLDPRRVRLIAESTLKTDRIDADTLAELARIRTKLLTACWQRSAETQRERGVLRARRALVEARARFVVTIRGLLGSFGVKIPSCASDCFVVRCRACQIPEGLASVIEPLLGAISDLDHRIEAANQRVAQQAAAHPAVEVMKAIPGVGPIVSLAYVLSIEDPRRFRRSRDVPGYLGLRPSLRASSMTLQCGRITKQGDEDLRRLLVQAAHAHLRSHTKTALQDWATGLIPRIGKRKAIIALARKLAVLLHRLWITGETYTPYPAATTAAA